MAPPQAPVAKQLVHAKIMLTASVGRLHPHPDQLARMVAHAHELGFRWRSTR